tara:strand:- start:40521 stop:41111 length:591 start_codon:yes stop_codon:yes gene_type:complete
MSALKSWFPFRFPRNNKRQTNNNNVDAVPVKANSGNSGANNNGANHGGLTIAGMRDEMDRMFERMWSNPLAQFEQSERWFGDFSSAEFLPKLDVSDDAECLRLTLEAPGVEEKDLDIEVQDGLLIISGEKKQEQASEDEGCYRTERSYGFFRRAIPLPDEVDPNQAEAQLDKGVVTIKLPKTESARKQTVRIPVKS